MSPTGMSSDPQVIDIDTGKRAVLKRKYERRYGSLPPEELSLELFHKLIEIENSPLDLKYSGRPYMEISNSKTGYVYRLLIHLNVLAELPLRWGGAVNDEVLAWLSKIDGREVKIPWIEIGRETRREPFLAEVDTSTTYWRILSNVLKEQNSFDASLSASKARGETVANRILDERSVEVEVKYAEFEGKKGYFSRYSKDGKDICIFFSRQFDRYNVRRLLDFGHKKDIRMPWKRIEAGEKFIFKAPLGFDAIRILESPHSRIRNVFYVDTSALNRDFFMKTEAEEIGEKVIAFNRQ